MPNFIPFLIIMAKSVAIYIFIIGAIRLFGKKKLAQLSIIDLVFILLINNSVQNAMVGNDSTLQGGIAAALGLFICNYIFKLFLRKSSAFSKIVQGEKILIVMDGKVLQLGLKQSMMSIEELQMATREHGVKDISQVDLIVLEVVDGNIKQRCVGLCHKACIWCLLKNPGVG